MDVVLHSGERSFGGGGEREGECGWGENKEFLFSFFLVGPLPPAEWSQCILSGSSYGQLVKEGQINTPVYSLANMAAMRNTAFCPTRIVP